MNCKANIVIQYNGCIVEEYQGENLSIIVREILSKYNNINTNKISFESCFVKIIIFLLKI